MIMIRPNHTTKVAKPPPPVPPRPSKTIVAEALAKTRKQAPEIANKPTIPIRCAPPPPKNDAIVKSKSYTAVSAYGNSKPNIERSISVTEEDKKNTRTVIFQSSQMKTSKIEVNLTRKDSNKVPIKRVSSFKSAFEPNEQLESKVEVTLKRRESDKQIKQLHDFKIDDAINKPDDNASWNEVLNDRNHVNTLIDEMFANVLDNASDSDVAEPTNDGKPIHAIDPATDKTKIRIQSNSTSDSNISKSTVLVIENTCEESSDLTQSLPPILNNNNNNQKDSNMDNKSASSTGERKEKRVKFDDKMNHELLVAEIQNMHKDEIKISKRQQKPPLNLNDESSKISHSDWIEVNNGKEVRLSSCQITIEEKNNQSASHNDDLLYRLSEMSNLQGLPPLPKSLSGFNIMEVPQTPNSRPSSSRTSTPGSGHMVYPPHPRGNINGNEINSKKTTNLDSQLAILRREMVSCNCIYFSSKLLA